MATLKDIISLCEKDGGKVFVTDENGEVKLVILSIEDYQKVLGTKTQAPLENPNVEDAEIVNKQILKAQLEGPSHISAALESKLKQWPGKFSVPQVKSEGGGGVTEAIDPTFDLESSKKDSDDF